MAPTQKLPMDGRSIIKASWIFRDAKASSIAYQHPTEEGYQYFITTDTGRKGEERGRYSLQMPPSGYLYIMRNLAMETAGIQ